MFPEAQALDFQGLGDPAPSCGRRVDGVPKLRFSTISFRASQKDFVGGQDHSALSRPSPFSLCSSGGPSPLPLLLPPTARQVGRGTPGCNPWLPTQKS